MNIDIKAILWYKNIGESKMSKEEIRTRIFELLDLIYLKEIKNPIFKMRDSLLKKTRKKIKEKQFEELVDLLINKNPYTNNRKAKIWYRKNLRTDIGKVDGCYDSLTDVVKVEKRLVLRAIKKSFLFFDVVSVLAHEQKHQSQHLEEQEDLAFINDVRNELFDGYFTKNDLKELGKFVAKYGLKEKKLTHKQVRKYEYGAYLANACEVDARKYAYEFTNEMYEYLVNDEKCTEDIRKMLNKAIDNYNYCYDLYEEYYVEEMEGFASLRNKIKNAFSNLMKNNKEKLNEAKNIELLFRIMLYISKDMTAEEKVEYINWSVENDYPDLLYRISYNKNGEDRQMITQCLDKIIEENKINTDNANDLFTVYTAQYDDFDEMKEQNTKFFIKLMNEKQIELFDWVTNFLAYDEIDFNAIVDKFISVSKLIIENNKQFKFDQWLSMRDSVYKFMYSGQCESYIGELKSIDEKCSKKLDETRPEEA